MIYAHAGDLFFTSGSSLLARAIRWVETEDGEEPTLTNHVGLVTGSGFMIPPEEFAKGDLAGTVEALWRVEHTRWWERHGHEPTTLMVWRPVTLDTAGLHRMANYAYKQVGNKYGWWKLGFHALKRFAGIDARSAMHIDKRPICSYLAAKAYSLANIHFGGLAAIQTPDSMHDYVRNMRDVTWWFVGKETINVG